MSEKIWRIYAKNAANLKNYFGNMTHNEAACRTKAENYACGMIKEAYANLNKNHTIIKKISI